MLRTVTGVRPILNPREVPVSGTDAHLPPLLGDWLRAEALREHWAQVPLVAPERPGDGNRFPGRAPRAASVLVPLVMRDAGLTVLLTRRTDALKDHAGQISFPGGGVDAADASVWDTALREAEEEIGLDRQHVEPLGLLPVYSTVSAFEVTPCVGLVRPGFALRLQADEVAEAFEVPLGFLMDPSHHRRHRMQFMGMDREFLSMPWPDESGYFIWGATAAMLRNLYHQLAQGR